MSRIAWVIVAAIAPLLMIRVSAWQTRAWPPPLQKVKPDSPPLSPADARKTFFMPPGYGVELVASEPMVVDPVAIDFDLEGRLWVVEMLGFMPDTSGKDSRDPLGRVVVLEDDNDDGTMDRRTVFLDKLVLPRSLKVLDRGVLVAEPPNLWLARDKDGDLKADTKDLVRNDFGRLEGNPEHNANGLHWALDNVIYTSEHTYHLETKHGELSVQPALSRGQWGVTSDDAGRIFRNWNEQPLFADVIAARYYVRNPNLARTRGLYELLMNPADMTVWPVRPTLGINRGYREGMLRADGSLATYTSAGSPVIYRGDRLPRELYGNAFVTESAGNLVHRLVLGDDGAGRLFARNAYPKGEFLASTDERFRPVNLFSGPDGTLYVVDMYRGVIQDGQYWTDYLRDYIKKNKLELPVGMGRIWRVVHESTRRDRKPSLSKASAADLVALLAHPNGWHRDTAQRLLVERRERSVVAALQQMAAHASWRTRLHALWTLDGLDAIDAATVGNALIDKWPEVRTSAIRLAERWLGEPNHPLEAAVLSSMSDRNWTVRRQLAASLGSLSPGERLEPIVAVLRRFGRDAVCVDAAISGLAGQEMDALKRLLLATAPAPAAPVLDDPIAMLAAAIVRGRDAAAVAAVLDMATDARRSPAHQAAMLRGVDLAFTGARGTTGPGGRGTGPIALAQAPSAIIKLAATGGEAGALGKRIIARVTWPGKPPPPAGAPALTAEEQKRFAQGREVYKNLCTACHQPDGRGLDKIAPTLVNSRYVVGNPGIPIRIVLDGKEGGLALMPPLRAGLSDDQIAAVLTYIRREWGHTASAVAPADVKEIRGMTSTRKRPWTEAEIAKLAGGGRAGQ